MKKGTNGLLWGIVGKGGARLKFIQIIIKLIHSKLFSAKNTSKKQSNKVNLNSKKINRNKFGFPTLD